jgi:predicted nuclease with TOPRIM domain
MSEVDMKLQKELELATNNIKGLIAQLEATKQMLNEQLASNLQLRTNVHMFANANKEFVDHNSQLQKEIENLKQHIITLATKINELTPKPELPPTTDSLAGDCQNAVNP